MFINILPSVEGALRTSVLGSIPGFCEITSTPGDAALLTIGLVNSAWPDIPADQKIMLIKDGAVETVPTNAHLFYEHTLMHVESYITLTEFIRRRA
ncbi:MAG: hypothetical protein QG568_604 [Patescibacteria group bacterium]|nr:hypothetical protein [Patescibacteria group bacterium]